MNEFSVYQWFEDDSLEIVASFVSVEQAMKQAVGLVNSVGGRIGTTIRVVVVDGGDCIAWEWKYGRGVVFPLKLAHG